MAILNTDNLLTTAQAGDALGLSTDTVKVYCTKGKIDAVKVGHIWMIPKKEVDRYKRERNTVGRPKND